MTATQIPASGHEIVGRGAREGARLFRDWFASLTDAAERGERAAYCFVMGNMNEVLRTFDIPIVFPEIHALQTAVRGVSEDYLREAEDYGYSPDICGYLKADVAIQLRRGKHPMARIPKPLLAVTTNACNTYFKWAEAWERLHDCPTLIVDIPAERAVDTRSRPGHADYRFELDFVIGQVTEMIDACERATGRRFDIDKFREHLRYANQMSAAWRRIIELNERSPAVFNALTDGVVYLGMANCFRATEAGSRYFRQLQEEMEYRAAHGIGAFKRSDGQDVIGEQRFRLGFIGVPCYPIFRGFNEFFTGWDGVFVMSTYLTFASGGTAIGFEYDLDRPVESFAEGLMQTVRHTIGDLLFETAAMEETLHRFRLDGLVYHAIKSCRTASAGLADRRRHVAEKLGYPTLFLESDLIDPRAVSQAQMKNRTDAFFEGLISRQQRRQ